MTFVSDEILVAGRDPEATEVIPVFGRWFGSWRLSVERRVLDAAALRGSYDTAAAGWARKLDRLGVPARYRSFLADVVGDVGDVGKGDTPPDVLDCGVGTGALSVAYLRTAARPPRLSGIDISDEMLGKTYETLVAHGVEPDLLRGDIRDLPYPNESFDVVLSGHVIEHLPDPVAALREMARVLRPGGKLVLCVTRRSLAGLFIQLLWRTHRVGGDEAREWLARAGLRGIEVRALCNLSLGCVARKPELETW